MGAVVRRSAGDVVQYLKHGRDGRWMLPSSSNALILLARAGFSLTDRAAS